MIFLCGTVIIPWCNGDVPKWLKGADSKSARRRKACGGSTPSISARKRLRIGYNSESFSTNSTLMGGINRIHDEIPLVWDEIRLDSGWVDLI